MFIQIQLTTLIEHTLIVIPVDEHSPPVFMYIIEALLL